MNSTITNIIVILCTIGMALAGIVGFYVGHGGKGKNKDKKED